MAEGEGNGKSYAHVENLEAKYKSNIWGAAGEAASQVLDENDRQLAQYVFDSKDVEEVVAKLHGIKRGSWLDNLLLAGASVGGMLAGYGAQRWIDARKGPVPLTGLLGLAGVAGGLALDRSLTSRNVLGLGGMLFLAGAGLYTREHPLEVGEDE